MKIRIKFAKYGVLKFIGHLDVMRFFQKAMRRADVDIKYTTGFSPHQVMSFAQPLGLGVTSDGEYVDIEVLHCGTSQEMVRRLNEISVEGLEIKSFRLLPDTAKNAMASIAAADYFLTLRGGYTCPFSVEEAWTRLYAKEEILVTKETKTKTDTVNIRPYLYEGSVKDGALYVRLSCGSVMNIKPELLIEALYAQEGYELTPFAWCTHRIELYTDVATTEGSHTFVSLEDCATEITEELYEQKAGEEE